MSLCLTKPAETCEKVGGQRGEVAYSKGPEAESSQTAAGHTKASVYPCTLIQESFYLISHEYRSLCPNKSGNFFKLKNN